MDRAPRACARRWAPMAIVGALLAPSPAPGQPDEPALALEAVGDAIELRRQVRAVGDDPVLAAIDGDRLELRLGALRAVRWLDEPERALAPLAALAAGDDPDLAPTAARAARQIAEALRSDELNAREADLAPLDPSPWQALADDESAREDLRGVGQRVAQLLGALHPPLTAAE